jgi:hypothetical protein
MRRHVTAHPHGIRSGGSYWGEKLVVKIILGGRFSQGNTVDQRREMRYVNSVASLPGQVRSETLGFLCCSMPSPPVGESWLSFEQHEAGYLQVIPDGSSDLRLC